MMVYGNPAEPRGINIEGLRRRGFSGEQITAVRRAYKILYRQGLTTEAALELLRSLVVDHPELTLLVDSLEASRRGNVRWRQRDGTWGEWEIGRAPCRERRGVCER